LHHGERKGNEGPDEHVRKAKERGKKNMGFSAYRGGRRGGGEEKWVAS